MATGTTLQYSSSRLVCRVPVDMMEGKAVYANSTIIPRFNLAAADIDDVLELAKLTVAIIEPPVNTEPVHVDAITTARFVNTTEGFHG